MEAAEIAYALLSDATVFVALAAIVMYTVSKHEPWADEAETWVEVRDVPWLRLVFSQLRYDGHLPLWHAIVWVPIHLFHMPYDYFVYIGGVCAVAGLAVLVFLAPFPRPLRYVIAASFFFLYQYAVVARPYVLMPLLGFLAAYFYRQGLPRVMAFAIATALLIQDSTYAAVIGFGLSAFYAWQIARRWKDSFRGGPQARLARGRGDCGVADFWRDCAVSEGGFAAYGGGDARELVSSPASGGGRIDGGVRAGHVAGDPVAGAGWRVGLSTARVAAAVADRGRNSAGIWIRARLRSSPGVDHDCVCCFPVGSVADGGTVRRLAALFTVVAPGIACGAAGDFWLALRVVVQGGAREIGLDLIRGRWMRRNT